MEQVVERRERLDSLTGLRALAALAVFASHAGRVFPDVPVATIAGRQLTAGTVTSPGNVGVSFFFILSGFVLAWSARPSTDTKRAFFGRRFARIYPLHLVTWAGWLALAAFGLVRLADWWTALVSLLLLQAWLPLLQKVVPIQQSLTGNQAVYGVPNPPSWSLSCEAFFYALFPFAYRWMRRRSPEGASRLVLLFGGLALGVPVTLWLLQPLIGKETAQYLGYAFPPTRILEFLTGMAVALVVASGRWRRVPLGWAMLAASVAYLAARWIPRPISFVAVTFVPFMLVVVAAAGRDLAGRRTFWAHPVVRYAGEISFAFYLTQYAVIDLVTEYWPSRIPSIGRGFAISVVALVATTLVAMALHHGVERPCERWLRARIGRSKEPRANDVPVWSGPADPDPTT